VKETTTSRRRPWADLNGEDPQSWTCRTMGHNSSGGCCICHLAGVSRVKQRFTLLPSPARNITLIKRSQHLRSARHAGRPRVAWPRVFRQPSSLSLACKPFFLAGGNHIWDTFLQLSWTFPGTVFWTTRGTRGARGARGAYAGRTRGRPACLALP
jgi:hypothetical protein